MTKKWPKNDQKMTKKWLLWTTLLWLVITIMTVFETDHVVGLMAYATGWCNSMGNEQFNLTRTTAHKDGCYWWFWECLKRCKVLQVYEYSAQQYKNVLDFTVKAFRRASGTVTTYWAATVEHKYSWTPLNPYPSADEKTYGLLEVMVHEERFWCKNVFWFPKKVWIIRGSVMG